MLLNQATLGTLAKIHSDPSFHPLSTTRTEALAPLQSYALALIDARFRLRAIHADRMGYTVVELVARRR